METVIRESRRIRPRHQNTQRMTKAQRKNNEVFWILVTIDLLSLALIIYFGLTS